MNVADEPMSGVGYIRFDTTNQIGMRPFARKRSLVRQFFHVGPAALQESHGDALYILQSATLLKKRKAASVNATSQWREFTDENQLNDLKPWDTNQIY